MTVGGVELDYDPSFKLFMTCNLGNPLFSPELSAKATIIDFTVTQVGLEQQLLSVVLTKEQRALEESLNTLMREVTQNKKDLKLLDDLLLRKLTTSTGNLLDDLELVEILNNTKTQSKEVKNKLYDAEIKTKEINEKRETYRPVAIRGSVLYFSMLEIAQVNWMYNSSLKQFLTLYNYSIDTATKATLPQKRVENISKDLTYNVYRYVDRGLFERDKVTFLLQVCFKILITDKKLNGNDIAIFLKGEDAIDKSAAKQKPGNAEWLTDKMWLAVVALSLHKFNGDSMAFFKNLPESVANTIEVWRKWAYEKAEPEKYPIPDYNDQINSDKEMGDFLKLCLVRCFRKDRVMVACLQFIEATLQDKAYVDPVTNSYESIFQSASPNQPVLFLLSSGADPTADVDELARKKRRAIHKVSLGEGQEKKAEALINESYEKGSWVLLQNCHLGMKFMAQLDNFLLDEDFIAKAEPDFRIWMSCEPRDGFPLGLLQKAVKVTNEPPKGVRAGLLRTFSTIVNPEFLEKIDHPNWRTLTYGVCFLHSIVIERKKFGALGWCVPYEYNNSDLQASLLFIERYLDNLQKISGQATNPNQNFQINYTE